MERMGLGRIYFNWGWVIWELKDMDYGFPNNIINAIVIIF